MPIGLGGSTWEVVIDTAVRSNRDAFVETCDEWKVDSWGLVLLERTNTWPTGIVPEALSAGA